MLFGWRVNGVLDHAVFSAAMRLLYERHDSLRTVFVGTTGPIFITRPSTAELVVRDEGPAPVFLDLRDLSDENRFAWLQSFLASEARESLSDDGSPLLRLHVLQTSDVEHIVIITVSHIIWDRESAAIFARDLAELYACSLERRPSTLPFLDVSECHRLASHAAEANRPATTNYWREQLAGLEAALPPSGCGWPETPEFALRERFWQAGTERTERIAQTRANGVTSFMTCLGMAATWLGRLTGNTTVGLVTPISLRRDSVEQQMIGCFVRLPILRFDLMSSTSPTDLSTRAGNQLLSALRHANTFYESLLGGPNAILARMGADVAAATIEDRYRTVIDFLPGGGATTAVNVNYVRYSAEFSPVPSAGMTLVPFFPEPEFGLPNRHHGFNVDVTFVDMPEDLVCVFHGSTDLYSDVDLDHWVAEFDDMAVDFVG